MYRLSALVLLLVASASAFQASMLAFAPHKTALSKSARYITQDAYDVLSPKKWTPKKEHVNENDSRETDDVRVLVQDTLRVFNRDPPKYRATGYSGDVGKGSSDAYDVLSPKKWTPKKEHVDEKYSRETDEVRVLVQDTLRVFSRDPPKYRATGYSGEVGKGSSDAYDVLSPKKWTPKKE